MIYNFTSKGFDWNLKIEKGWELNWNWDALFILMIQNDTITVYTLFCHEIWKCILSVIFRSAQKQILYVIPPSPSAREVLLETWSNLFLIWQTNKVRECQLLPNAFQIICILTLMLYDGNANLRKLIMLLFSAPKLPTLI